MKRTPVVFPVVATLVCIWLALTPTESPGAATETRDLGLAEAVRTALDKNLNLKLRQEDVALAEGTALAAEGPFDPLLSADVGATKKDMAPVTIITAEEERTAFWNASVSKRFSAGTEIDLSWENNNLDTDSDIYLFDPVYSSGLTLSLSQPLLRGLGEQTQLADLNSATSRLEASSYLVTSEAADLASEVKTAYWELVYAHQNLEVLQLALRLAEKLRDDTAARIEAGKLASIDIYQPESEVARREEDLIGGERAIGVAEDNLKFLMNSQDWLQPFRPVDRPDVTPQQPDMQRVLNHALANRPDIKAATLQVQAAEYQLGKADNETLPALDLVGAVGLGGTEGTYADAVDRSFSDSETQWQIGLVLSRPLDNSLAEGRYRQAVAQRNKDQTNLELLKQGIRRTVRVTVRDVELAIKAIEATQKTALATRKSLEAEQVKFDAGRSTTLDVLIAQQEYSNALSAENRAKVIYAQVLAELDRIQGLVTVTN